MTKQEFEKLYKLCNNLGIVTLRDLQLFVQENMNDGNDLLKTMSAYFLDLRSATRKRKFKN